MKIAYYSRITVFLIVYISVVVNIGYNERKSSVPGKHDLCGGINGSDCEVMGLSYIGTPCVANKSCTINEDNGLILAFVIAHEIGHVMGCAHDGPKESGCEPKDKDGSYFVMSPNIHIHTIRWSPCSRAFIKDIFDNELGECLLDKPEISLYKQNDILPGVIYDGQAQCEMFIPGSTIKIYDEEKFCEELICKINATTCISTGESLVDGTKCGENKWCFQRSCIEAGKRPNAINGGWSDWETPTTCSRTCGGGVTMSERKCNNPLPANGGRNCQGDHLKIWICNPDPCPFNEPTFRDVQCGEGNKKSNEGPWKAYFDPDESCVLFCINDKSVIRKIEPRAKDGTPCKPGTKNMCISGICTKVGCDYVIDSDAVEDICGICNGDSTECQIVQDYFNDTGQNYQEITTFPVESRNILIEELGSSPNIIALKDKAKDRFILNGDNKECPDIVFAIDQTEAIYRHPEPDREILAIKGPLCTEKIFYICFFKPNNVGYKYRYAKMIADTKKIGIYHWEILEYERCSANCEGGIQEPIVGCVEENGGKVSPRFCKHVKKLAAPTQKCNLRPCHRRWRVGKWGKCHACEFRSGVRSRRVECVKESPHPGGEEILVDDKECTGPQPATKELCNAVRVCRCRRKTTWGIPNQQLEDVWKQLKNAENTVKINEELPDISETECFQNIHEGNNENNASGVLTKNTNSSLDITLEIPKKKKLNGTENNDEACEKPTEENDEKCDEKTDKNQSKIPDEFEIVDVASGDSSDRNDMNDMENICAIEPKTEKTKELKVPPDEPSEVVCEKIVKVNIGDVVVDKNEKSGPEIFEIPFKEASFSLNFSDVAFQELGDLAGDTLMTDSRRNFSGHEAKEEIKKIRKKLHPKI